MAVEVSQNPSITVPFESCRKLGCPIMAESWSHANKKYDDEMTAFTANCWIYKRANNKATVESKATYKNPQRYHTHDLPDTIGTAPDFCEQL